MNELEVMLTIMMFIDVGVFNRVDANYVGSLLWWNDVFFSWVRLIQMNMVINISIDLLIETRISIDNFIMKRKCVVIY
jgi:hypothetical protein